MIMWGIMQEFLKGEFKVTSLDFIVILVLVMWDYDTGSNTLLYINVGPSISSKHLDIFGDCFIWSTVFSDYI